MNGKTNFSRRSLFKGMAATAAAAAAARMTGGDWVKDALAQGAEKPALLLVFLNGGYNSLFGSADSFANTSFGVTNQNMLNLGNGLVVDSSFSVLSAFAKQHMATVGVRHGISNHGGAQMADMTVMNNNGALVLGSSLGGSGSIKAANAGQQLVPGPRAAYGGVSLQTIADMKSTIDALGGGTPDPTMPKREYALKGVVGANAMSATGIARSPVSLVSLRDGYKSAVETLTKPAEVFSAQELQTAYTVTGTAVNSFQSKIAAAELMIRAGSNVVTVSDGGWDTHGDTNGARVRQMMSTRILPPLKALTDRLLQSPDRNVVVCIMGDFARSLPGSDHAAVMAATVIGKYVKVGTTGKVDNKVGMPVGTPSNAGLWAYLAAVLKAPAATISAMGGNPHTAITG